MRGNGNPPASPERGQAAEAARLLRDGLSDKPASPFRMTPHGLLGFPDGDKSVWLSFPFEVVAQTRNAEGKDWGLLLRWYDPDSVEQECAIPYAALGGSADEIWQTMLGGGLMITSTRGGREKLALHLSTARSSVRARGVARTGWYIAPPVAAYVLPDRTYGESAYERIRWQTATQGETLYRIAGTLEEWKNAIGRRCVANSRLTICVSAGFAAPLLRLAEEPGGVVHLFGTSQTGKTTLQYAAGSVWGGGPINGYLRSWRTTANAAEATFEAHCDALLCLNELGEVNAREVGAIAYMAANGSGKGRGRRDGSARPVAQWIS